MLTCLLKPLLKTPSSYDAPLDVFSFGQLALYVALQEFPVPYEMSHEESSEAYLSRESAILKRKKWLDKLPEDHCLLHLILSCLRDSPSERPSTERLNMKMKLLYGLKFEKFKIKDGVVINDEMYGSYVAVSKVIIRGEARIAKRLYNILNSELINDVSPGKKQSIWKQFHEDCLALSKLDHDNILKFSGIYFNPEDQFDIAIIFDESLHLNLKEFLNVNELSDIHLYTKLSILCDISCGLLYLHTGLETPLVHGELTAENILLSPDLKQVKIANLGVFRLIDEHVDKAVKHKECSTTLAYMPPPYDDKADYGASLDIFSFGHLALYVALQHFPQVAPELSLELKKSNAERIDRGESEILKRKEWLDKLELPEDHYLCRLICHCLRDDPNERPKTDIINMIMKEQCGLELQQFNIEGVEIMEDGDIYGRSYIGVYKVVSRSLRANSEAAAAPQIAMRVNDILNFLKDLSSSEKQCIRERFYNECMALSKLSHPNILQFTGVHINPEDQSDIVIMFECLHMSLEEFMNPQELPDIHLITKLSILYDVSCGLLYLHTELEMPFVHGELTAANVLLSEDLQQAKIANLGVLKLLQNHDNVQHTGDYGARTLPYLPPEAFMGNTGRLKYDIPVDVFSFGHLALCVALQQFPEISHEQSLPVTCKKHETEILKRKEWTDKLAHDRVTKRLQDLILQCLKDEPDKRPTTAEVNNSILSTLNCAVGPEKVITVRPTKTIVHTCTLLC